MATYIKASDHLFIPFDKFGMAIHDGKGNPKIYKDEDTLKRYCVPKPGAQPWEIRQKDYAFIQEYAPVVKAHWIHLSSCDKCSECGYETGKYEDAGRFCKACGALMIEKKGDNDG